MHDQWMLTLHKVKSILTAILDKKSRFVQIVQLFYNQLAILVLGRVKLLANVDLQLRKVITNYGRFADRLFAYV